MRVLWTTNTIAPSVAKDINAVSVHSISWVDAMSKELCKCDDIELAIAFPGSNDGYKKVVHNSITYYTVQHQRDFGKYWKTIIDDFKPDIIHAYGTERPHNVPLIDMYKDKLPIIISLQGLLTEYKKYCSVGVDNSDILRNIKFGDIFKLKGIWWNKYFYNKYSKSEEKMISSVRYVEGRSDWDKAVTTSINPDLKYYYCPRMVREPFFNYEWNENLCEKHSLFVHQGTSPIKGTHYMIDALALIKRKYSDVKLYISGNDIFSGKAKTAFVQILQKKIKEYNLSENIVFTGYLNAEEMAKKLCTVNACVICSSIENAPNSIAEAMLLGVPCIASYVGGNADMLNYGECGLLYCYNEPQMLADRVDYLFSHSSEISEKSRLAKNVARERHNPDKLVNTLKGIYSDVIDDFNKK